VKLLASNPRHPSLSVHKAKNINSKYAEGGDSVFIAYATKDLRLTFEYGPEPGMIALRNCGPHDVSERKIQELERYGKASLSPSQEHVTSDIERMGQLPGKKSRRSISSISRVMQLCGRR